MSKNKRNMLPFVSICTPTYNRRPFYEMTIECFNHQTYPKDRMEWIIIDDGTDKIEDLVSNIPQVKYFKYEEKMTLGRKRNLMHEKSKGDIIIYFDDDDYYPPERVSHAVEMLISNPNVLIAGSSEMYIYFKDMGSMYKFGPYGKYHSTAATFAFKKEYLRKYKYDENALLAEEKQFLNNYKEPLVQLDSMKTILVFSHIHNSLDKKHLLPKNGENNPYISISDKRIEQFVKEDNIRDFLLNKLEPLLIDYEPGRIENKPDVLKEVNRFLKNKQDREDEHKNRIIKEQQQFIERLIHENKNMKEQVEYYKNKINSLLKELITEKKKNKDNQK